MALEFSAESLAKIQDALDEFYNVQSALLPVIYVAQEQFGFINSEALELVARRLDLPRMHVESVASFYTMYYKHPVGRYHIQVCRTLSCALHGSLKLIDYIEKKVGVKPGEVTSDGKFSVEAAECLAMCGTAPAMIINKTNYENLTEAKIDQILDSLE